MTTTEITTMKQKLVNALTDYDRKQSTRRSYNPHALALYFEALDDAMAAVERGCNIRKALADSFNDRVLDACLRAIA
jgi:hypothetical protein